MPAAWTQGRPGHRQFAVTEMRTYDISTPLSAATATYQGDLSFRLRYLSRLDKGAPFSLSALSMASHSGTHVDAPAHFIQGAATVEELPLEALMGLAYLYDAGPVTIGSEALEAARIPRGVERLLIRTNSETGSTDTDIGLSLEGAEWLLNRNIRLVGVDMLSIEPDSSNDYPVHKAFLQSGVVIVEGLSLEGVPAGMYHLYCLPLKVVGAEGAPARAVLVGTET